MTGIAGRCRRDDLPAVAGEAFRANCQNAQQEHPIAPQKDVTSDTGTFAAQDLAWAWPCTLQALAQPQAAAKAYFEAALLSARF